MTKEIFTVAGVMWALTLTGLSVGFGLLKIQGDYNIALLTLDSVSKSLVFNEYSNNCTYSFHGS